MLLNKAYRPEPSLPRGRRANTAGTKADDPANSPDRTVGGSPHTSILSVNWYKMTDAMYRERKAAAAMGAQCSIHEHTDVSLFTLIAIEPEVDNDPRSSSIDTCKPGLELRMSGTGASM